MQVEVKSVPNDARAESLEWFLDRLVLFMIKGSWGEFTIKIQKGKIVNVRKVETETYGK